MTSNLPYVLDSAWFKDVLLNSVDAQWKQNSQYRVLSYLILKIGKEPVPFDAHTWLKNLDDSDFNSIFQFFKSGTGFSDAALGYLSIAMRAKICDIGTLGNDPTDKTESVKFKAYIERLELLIDLTHQERQGLIQVMPVPFSDKDEEVKMGVDVKRSGLL